MTAASKLTWESMTYLTVGRFTVRVWRDEAEDIESDRRFSNGDLEDRARKLSAANELEVLKIAHAFRQAIKSTDGLGMLAFALVGAEIAAQE